MKIVIVGCGKVGEAIAETLCNEGHDISVIDVLKSKIDRVSYEYDLRGVCGNGTVPAVLKEAGASNADLIIATTALDETNLLSCIIATDMGAKRCIARVRDPKQNSQAVYLSQRLGISMIINPELLTSRSIASLLLMPSALEVDTFARGRIDMVQIKLSETSKICGKALVQLSGILRSRILVCAVQRPGVEEAIIPTGSFVLQAGDRVYITAPHKEMTSFFREMGILSSKIRKTIIIGGGRVAYYLALALQNTGIDIKIIEKDRERCFELAELLPKVSIINADGTDQKILMDEGLTECNSLVALTGLDEDNTIISMYAKLQGVSKVITKINKPELKVMGESVGLESVISPKQLTTEVMLTYVRSLQHTRNSKVRTVYRVANDKVEALEFLAESGCRALGVPLMKMKLKKNLLIAGIIRQGKVIFPGGNDMLQQGDVVIVVTTNKHISSLDGILE